MVHQFPRSSLKYIVDAAVKIIHIMDDMNIRNEDAKERNSVVTGEHESVEPVEDGKHPKPHVYMIDLALCRVRRLDESEGEWGSAKHSEYETGFAQHLK